MYVPRTSREDSIVRIGIGSEGSKGVRMSLGTELAIWRQTSPREWQLEYGMLVQWFRIASLPCPLERGSARNCRVVRECDKWNVRRTGLAEPNGMFDAFSDSHGVNNCSDLLSYGISKKLDMKSECGQYAAAWTVPSLFPSRLVAQGLGAFH